MDKFTELQQKTKAERDEEELSFIHDTMKNKADAVSLAFRDEINDERRKLRGLEDKFRDGDIDSLRQIVELELKLEKMADLKDRLEKKIAHYFGPIQF